MLLDITLPAGYSEYLSCFFDPFRLGNPLKAEVCQVFFDGLRVHPFLLIRHCERPMRDRDRLCLQDLLELFYGPIILAHKVKEPPSDYADDEVSRVQVLRFIYLCESFIKTARRH